MDDSDERVATCEYDGLPALDAAAAAARRWSRSDRGATLRPAVSRVPSIEKTVGNQGTGVVYGSDGSGDITGIEAGHPLTRRVGPCPMFVLRTPHAVRGGVSRAGRHEHYLWGGMGVSPVNWRLIETTNHAESAGDYSYSDADVLNQFVYRLGGVGVSPAGYIDEPLVYDRNEDPNEDDSCLDVDDGEDADGDSCRYFYHQDANFRVVALTDESAGVVERYRYTAYGEPMVFGGENASGDELANAMFVGSVGNPFMHQGLFRDRDIGSYQNRFRQYDAKWGRFLQRDPLGYAGGANLYEYVGSNSLRRMDPGGHDWWEWVPVVATIGHAIKNPKGSDSKDYAKHQPSAEQCDEDCFAAIKNCKDGINSDFLGYLSDWLGIRLSKDALQALGGTVAFALAKLAIKQGSRAVVGGAVTGGVLAVDAAADAAIVAAKAFNIHDAKQQAIKDYCQCPGTDCDECDE